MDLRCRVRFRHSGANRAIRTRIYPGSGALLPGWQPPTWRGERVTPMSTGCVPLMTAETDNDRSRKPFTAHEPARRSGSIVLVLLVAGGIVAAAGALLTIGPAHAPP